MPDESLRLVRKALAGLVRGRVESIEEERQTDADPEYLDWLDLVAQARQALQERADEGCRAGSIQGRSGSRRILADQGVPDKELESPPYFLSNTQTW